MEEQSEQVMEMQPEEVEQQVVVDEKPKRKPRARAPAASDVEAKLEYTQKLLEMQIKYQDKMLEQERMHNAEKFELLKRIQQRPVYTHPVSDDKPLATAKASKPSYFTFAD